MSTLFPRATLYQPGFHHFISFKTAASKADSALFFLSFEDALWTFCQHQLKKGDLFLVPSFYCMEVVEELLKRNFRIEYYPVLEDLRIDKKKLQLRLEELEPTVCILYHPLGADNGMRLDSEFLKSYSAIFFIEDCAHRLLEPLKVIVNAENHLVIDSLRKVTPFLGSRLFADKKVISALSVETPAGEFLNRMRIVSAYRLWRAVFGIASVLRIRFLWKFSEQLFENFNNRIGTPITPQKGPGLSRAAINMVDVHTVKNKKAKIAALYHSRLFDNQSLTTIALTPAEIAELKCYPVLFERGRAERIISLLENRGIYVDIIFSDSPACKARSVIGLPIDISLSTDRYDYIIESLLESVKKLEQEKI